MVEQTNKYSIILRLVPPAPQRFFYQRPGQTWGLRGASSMVVQTGFAAMRHGLQYLPLYNIPGGAQFGMETGFAAVRHGLQ